MKSIKITVMGFYIVINRKFKCLIITFMKMKELGYLLGIIAKVVFKTIKYIKIYQIQTN